MKTDLTLYRVSLRKSVTLKSSYIQSTMQLNMFSTTAKRVTKMTSKAKAALEEKAGTSKKRKGPESDGSGDNAASLHLKKAKTHQAAGITQSSSLTAAAKNDLSTVVSTWHAPSVVPLEEEEEDIIDVDGVDNKSKGSKSDHQEKRFSSI